MYSLAWEGLKLFSSKNELGMKRYSEWGFYCCIESILLIGKPVLGRSVGTKKELIHFCEDVHMELESNTR